MYLLYIHSCIFRYVLYIKGRAWAWRIRPNPYPVAASTGYISLITDTVLTCRLFIIDYIIDSILKPMATNRKSN